MKTEILKLIIEWTITLALTVVICFGLTTYVVQATEVLTDSMIHTYGLAPLFIRTILSARCSYATIQLIASVVYKVQKI